MAEHGTAGSIGKLAAMRMSKLLVMPLVLVALLSGCAVPAPNQVPNPIQSMIDLIPWAKSVADTASAEDVTARIDEISATLPTLEASQATKNEVAARLTALRAAVVAHPDERA